MSIFERYAPFIQDFIYQNSWESLRAIQVAAADVLFHSDDNLLLTSSTASGKTEAAFFPILTLFSEDPPRSVGALYIAPLKALINDQFVRLNDLCREGEIPVWHWHGDVSRSRKERLMKQPSGILQITPESLEALLLHRHGSIAHLFGDLRFIVIDEVHSLLRGDRGGQTLCLIERLCSLAGVRPRRIGLSATIGDPVTVGNLLSTGSGRRTQIPQIREPAIRWRLSMGHFPVGGPPGTPEQQPDSSGTDDPDRTDRAPEHADPGLGFIFEHTRGKKCLVFTNSREECEAVTTTLRQYCAARNEPDRFLIHHGNLSVSFRESAESAMKDEEQELTTVTTATLELGIDIGKLERAFQIDAPFTVSSFLQRMGRTGRRGLPPEMHFVIREEMAEPRAMLPATVPWKLLQALALVELYRKERWVEPPGTDRLPFSLLYHQTMSILASQGEMKASELAARVLPLTPFRRISRDDYRTLLRHLIATGQIQKTEEGGLIVGLAGERQINSFKFYAVFKENEEFTVRSRSQELGTIVRPPPVGEKIALAGHVWIVEEIDYKRRLIQCEEVPGKVPAYFGECPGDLHTRILEQMRELLRGNDVPGFLKHHAAERLAEARESARQSGMTDHPLIGLGGEMWCLFPWLGTYAFLALERLLKIKCAPMLGISAVDSSRPYFLQFKMKAPPRDFFRLLREQAQQVTDPMELLYPNEIPLFEKYDDFLPPELVRKGFACGILDLRTMRERIRQWSSSEEAGNTPAPQDA